MNKTSPDDSWDNDEVEIIDLPEQEGNSAVHHKLIRQFEQKATLPTITRAIRIGLVLMVCLLILVILSETRQFPFNHHTSNQPAISAAPNTIIGISVLNGFVYVNESDGSIVAYHANNGKLAWRVSLGATVYYTIAADQTIYCFLTKGDYGRVEAFRASDGSLLWTQQDTFAGNVNLLARDGILYINTERGVIHALRGSDGHQLWQFTAGMPMPFDGFLTINNGIVSIQTSRDTLSLVRESDGTLIYQYSSPLTLNDPIFPIIQDDFIAIVSHSGSVQVRNASDGSLLWHYDPIKGPGMWLPTVLDGILYINNAVGDSVSALRLQDGTPLWQFHPRSTVSAPALDNGIVYLTTADGSLFALRATDGTQSWQKKLPTNTISVFSPPVIDNHIMYVNLDQPTNTIFALQTSDGQLLWQHALHAGTLVYNPVIHNGIVYFGNDDRSIDAWQGSDGRFLWHYSSSAHILWYPEVLDNLMYVRSFNGTMDVLRITDGMRLWHFPLPQ